MKAFSVRCTEDQLRRWSNAAMAQGITRQEWVVRTLEGQVLVDDAAAVRNEVKNLDNAYAEAKTLPEGDIVSDFVRDGGEIRVRGDTAPRVFAPLPPGALLDPREEYVRKVKEAEARGEEYHLYPDGTLPPPEITFDGPGAPEMWRPGSTPITITAKLVGEEEAGPTEVYFPETERVAFAQDGETVPDPIPYVTRFGTQLIPPEGWMLCPKDHCVRPGSTCGQC